MYAVVFQVDMKPGRQEDQDQELDVMSGAMKSLPGFVRGTWTSDGTRGLSFIVFESADTARTVAANAAVPPDAAVRLRSADVYEVARDV